MVTQVVAASLFCFNLGSPRLIVTAPSSRPTGFARLRAALSIPPTIGLRH